MVLGSLLLSPKT